MAANAADRKAESCIQAGNHVRRERARAKG